MNPQNSNPEYCSRINRVMDYIEANLGETHTLEELAMVANFSKYHFHRIFTAMTGETPFQFLTRLRIEKAAGLLVSSRKMTISEVAFQCGFSGPALFSRTFNQYFGVSPTVWRSTRGTPDDKREQTVSNLIQKNSNQGQMIRNEREANEEVSMYFCHETRTFKWRTTMKLNKSMEVKQLPKMTVAYIRHTGPYQGDSNLFQRLIGELCTWAGPRGLLHGGDTGIMIFYHDDPKVTEQDKLRISVSMKVPEDTRVDGKIGKMEIAAGTYAIGRFEVDSSEFGEAWGWLYGTWLPQSGYQPDDGPCFEVYPEEPKAGEKIKVDICVPVRPI